MPSILITGEKSFICRNFIRFSSFSDVRVVSLRDTTPGSVDFTGIDTVLHLAAIVHRERAISAEEYYRINTRLTFDLASAAREAGVRHFIFMSTVKVYGNNCLANEPWTEFSECRPADNYGKSKYQAELKIRELENENFIVSVIRTPVVYGKGMKANMAKIMKMVKILPVIPLGDIENSRHYTYVKNLVTVTDRIIELRLPGIFIAADREPVSTTEIVRSFAVSMGKKTFIPGLPGLIRHFVKFFFPGTYERLYGSFFLDCSVTNERLKPMKIYSTAEGIADMISAE